MLNNFFSNKVDFQLLSTGFWTEILAGRKPVGIRKRKCAGVEGAGVVRPVSGWVRQVFLQQWTVSGVSGGMGCNEPQQETEKRKESRKEGRVPRAEGNEVV